MHHSDSADSRTCRLKPKVETVDCVLITQAQLQSLWKSCFLLKYIFYLVGICIQFHISKCGNLLLFSLYLVMESSHSHLLQLITVWIPFLVLFILSVIIVSYYTQIKSLKQNEKDEMTLNKADIVMRFSRCSLTRCYNKWEVKGPKKKRSEGRQNQTRWNLSTWDIKCLIKWNIRENKKRAKGVTLKCTCYMKREYDWNMFKKISNFFPFTGAWENSASKKQPDPYRQTVSCLPNHCRCDNWIIRLLWSLHLIEKLHFLLSRALFDCSKLPSFPNLTSATQVWSYQRSSVRGAREIAQSQLPVMIHWLIASHEDQRL